jgi:hypothetical protein
MNKSIVYKNFAEFIRITFPTIVKEEKYSDDTLLENFLKINSEKFKTGINEIMSNNKRPDGA